MQLKDKIAINFLEFFKTGEFDCLQLGQSKEYIINNFPDPDGFNGSFMHPRKSGDIWRYGNIELHFDKGNKLWMIFSDYINTLNGGKNLILEKWILEKPKELTLLKVIEHLNKEQIDFEKKAVFEQIKIKLLKSNVEISFLLEEKNQRTKFGIADPNDYVLGAFSLM